MILIIYAHPYPDKSRVNQQMLKRVSTNPDVVIRSLYELYPNFDIDVEAEQRAVEQAELVVLQHPMYWYSTPPLLKLWIDKVFTHGWAYGKDAIALKGKRLLWAVTTGGDHAHFAIGDYPDFFGAGPTAPRHGHLLRHALAGAGGRAWRLCRRPWGPTRTNRTLRRTPGRLEGRLKWRRTA